VSEEKEGNKSNKFSSEFTSILISLKPHKKDEKTA
jgi:hypothetical protein